jgi:hypothetical protein
MIQSDHVIVRLQVLQQQSKKMSASQVRAYTTQCFLLNSAAAITA